MGFERILRRQLIGDLPRKQRIKAAINIDLCQLLALHLGAVGKFARLLGEVGLLCVGLGADGDVFASRHRHGAGDESSSTGDKDRGAVRTRGGDADDQARGRDDSVIGAKHSCAQPADARDGVAFDVGLRAWHGRASPSLRHETQGRIHSALSLIKRRCLPGGVCSG